MEKSRKSELLCFSFNLLKFGMGGGGGYFEMLITKRTELKLENVLSKKIEIFYRF